MRKLWDNQLTAKQNLEKFGLSMDTNVVVDKEKIKNIVHTALSTDHNLEIEENNDVDENKNTSDKEDTMDKEPKRVGYDAAVPENYSEMTSSVKGLVKTEIRKAIHSQRLAKLGLPVNPSTMGDQILTELSNVVDTKKGKEDGKNLEEVFKVPISTNGDVSEIDRNPRRRIMSEEDQLYVSKLIKKYKDNYKVCIMNYCES